MQVDRGYTDPDISCQTLVPVGNEGPAHGVGGEAGVGGRVHRRRRGCGAGQLLGEKTIYETSENESPNWGLGLFVLHILTNNITNDDAQKPSNTSSLVR